MRTQTNTVHRGEVRRIPLDRIRLTQVKRGETAELVVDRLDINDFEFPSTAKVVLEHRNRRIGFSRYEIGYVGNLNLPWQTRVSRFTSLKGVDFRLLVVATEATVAIRSHSILGEADDVFPLMNEVSGIESLLAAIPAELGDVPWEVDCSDTWPVLKINNRFPDTESLQKQADFRLFAIVPAVRQIAEWLYDQEVEQTGGRAAAEWSIMLDAAQAGPCESVSDQSEHLRNRSDWSKRVADNFARTNQLFTKWLEQERGQEI